MKNQKGFATLEIILITAIISVSVFVAVPKFAQVIDKVTLDYEMKNFYNTVNLQRVLNRTTSYKPEIFFSKISPQQKTVELELISKGYRLRRNPENVGEVHGLPKGFSVEDNNPAGKSRTVTLISRFGDKAEIIFDSVGRWRVSRNGK